MAFRLFRAVRDAVSRVPGNVFSQVSYAHSTSTKGSRYIVYRARSLENAIKFLRSQDVKEPLLYKIVETPEGNIGRDLISIFNERTGENIELGHRSTMLLPQKSRSHCYCCGYYVMKSKPSEPIPNSTLFLALEDLREKGQGFYCEHCDLALCSFCATLKDRQVPCPSCGRGMDILYGER